MKVKELVEQLSKLDQELDVICYSEDECLLVPGHIFRLLHISDVSITEGENRRGDDGIPTLKLERSLLSSKYAVIEVTTDF
jgi:hypothetical protein